VREGGDGRKDVSIPDTILYRKISKEEALNVLHTDQSPQLKLE
jgi:hypothetical protein